MNSTVTTIRIDKAIRFFLYVLIFWLPYSSAVVESCVATAALLWWIKHGIFFFMNPWHEDSLSRRFFLALKTFPSPLNRPFLLFLFVCIMSILAGAFWDQSFRGFFSKTLEWFVLYVLALEVLREKRHFHIFLFVFLFTSLAVAADSLIQFYITGKDIFNGQLLVHGKRATASFSTSNSLGGYLIFVIPLSMSLLIAKFQNAWLRWATRVLFLIVCWSMFLTFSQGAWLGVMAGLMCFLLLYFRKRKMLTLFFLLGFLMCGSGIYYLNVKAHSHMGEHRTQQTESLDRSAYWRWHVWKDSYRMFRERPLLGHGVNTYMMLLQEYRSGIEHQKMTKGGVWDPTYAHNCYLQIAVETGVMGLLAFIWMIGTLYSRMIRTVFSIRESYSNWDIIYMGLFAGMVGFLIQSFLDTNFYSLKLSSLFWIMVGLWFSLDNLLRRYRKCDIKGDASQQHLLKVA